MTRPKITEVAPNGDQWISLQEPNNPTPAIGERHHVLQGAVVHYDCGAYGTGWAEADIRQVMLSKGITHWSPIEPLPVGHRNESESGTEK